MKEVMAIIRREKVNQTKEALLDAEIDSMTARKVLGRGKKGVSFEICKDIFSKQKVTPAIIDAVSESHRLISKRLLTIIVPDDKVKTVVDTIIKVNQTGSAGDGKIFVLPASESYRIRTGESGDEVL